MEASQDLLRVTFVVLEVQRRTQAVGADDRRMIRERQFDQSHKTGETALPRRHLLAHHAGVAVAEEKYQSAARDSFRAQLSRLLNDVACVRLRSCKRLMACSKNVRPACFALLVGPGGFKRNQRSFRHFTRRPGIHRAHGGIDVSIMQNHCERNKPGTPSETRSRSVSTLALPPSRLPWWDCAVTSSKAFRELAAHSSRTARFCSLRPQARAGLLARSRHRLQGSDRHHYFSCEQPARRLEFSRRKAPGRGGFRRRTFPSTPTMTRALRSLPKSCGVRLDGERNVVMLTLGTGVGGAALVDGVMFAEPPERPAISGT